MAAIGITGRDLRARELRATSAKTHEAKAAALPTLVADELRSHRLRQAEELLRRGVRACDQYTHHFPGDGRWLQPNSLTREFTRGPWLGAHLLSSGVHPEVAQERLGHSTISITLDLYSQVMPGMQEDAASKVDAAIRAAMIMV